jgi:glucose-1-phosphate thymidylyltransferase
MIPIGRPFLDYTISGLADAGITDVCLVIGPEHTRVREYYERDVPTSRVRVHFAVQREPRGTADAILAAEAFASGEHFLALNGDNHYPVATHRALRELRGPGLAAFDRRGLVAQGNIDAARIAAFSLVRVTPDGFLDRIVEKPSASDTAALGERALVGMNSWSLPPVIFDACRAIGPSARGELELPNAVQHAVDEWSVRFRVLPFNAGVIDLSTRADIETAARLLEGVAVRL